MFPSEWISKSLSRSSRVGYFCHYPPQFLEKWLPPFQKSLHCEETRTISARAAGALLLILAPLREASPPDSVGIGKPLQLGHIDSSMSGLPSRIRIPSNIISRESRASILSMIWV